MPGTWYCVAIGISCCMPGGHKSNHNGHMLQAMHLPHLHYWLFPDTKPRISGSKSNNDHVRHCPPFLLCLVLLNDVGTHVLVVSLLCKLISQDTVIVALLISLSALTVSLSASWWIRKRCSACTVAGPLLRQAVSYLVTASHQIITCVISASNIPRDKPCACSAAEVFTLCSALAFLCQAAKTSSVKATLLATCRLQALKSTLAFSLYHTLLIRHSKQQ